MMKFHLMRMGWRLVRNTGVRSCSDPLLEAQERGLVARNTSRFDGRWHALQRILAG
jgi:hypothetical protein